MSLVNYYTFDVSFLVLMNLFIILVSSGYGIALGGPLSLRRLDESTPFAYPAGCTGAMKPSSERFCAVGTTSEQKFQMAIYLFDEKQTTKSTHFNIEVTLGGSRPTGLSITAGGCANVVDKNFVVLYGTVQLCFETVGDGRGEFDEATGNWNAAVQLKAAAKAGAFGKSFNLNADKVVKAHVGQNNDFGLDASFQKTTGDDKSKGLGLILDLTFNTKDHSLYTWQLTAGAGLHAWFSPFFDKKVTVDIFKRKFSISPP